ncbi:NYN domain-containing protein (plasmid) [Synechocystis sp. B12]|nr:NYN domain-containing protein [Synechocystis sp. B12]
MQNTAIFYDIENLLKGYNDPQTVAKNISLKETINQIKAVEIVGGIGIQRAYANWSDYRLKTIAQEVSKLGIEPIQLFGLSWNQKKNAADIQLAVDVIDLVYVRPWFDVFVIVSGDGGFSALGKSYMNAEEK